MRFVIMQRLALVFGVAFILCTGVIRAEDDSTSTKAPTSIPAKWDSEHRDALKDAEQVWRLGERYFEGSRPDWTHDGGEKIDFSGIDLATMKFLAHPDLKPVVQFSCVSHSTPYEDALEEAIVKGSPELKLQALAILVRLRVPSSVPLQWKALGELRQLKDRPQWQPLLAEWHACFDPERLERELRQTPPQHEDYRSEPREYFWSIRAAGVIQDVGALDRLATLSTADHSFTSLAAERSLEDFVGAKADQALARCVLGWKSDAYVRAADTLLKRDKPLLTKVLLENKAPKDCRHHQGVFLARCDNTAAVGILCEEIPKYQIIDTEMFAHIARLGGAEHREVIQSLPARVRPDQRDLAEHTVKRFTAKLKHRSEQSSSEQAKAIVRMEDAGAEVVMDEARPGSPVTKLDCSNYSSVKDADLQWVSRFAHLEWLNLSGTQVTDAGLKYLEGLTNLQSLDLSSTQVTDAGLAHLKTLRQLSSLALSGLQVTDAGLKHLEGLTNLQSLDLSFTQVTDAGLKHLKGFTKLRTLTLLDNNVTDAGLEHLKGLTSLESLSLDQTKVTGVGLAELEGLTGLHTLSLDGTEMTAAGLNSLRSLTNLKVLTLYRTEVRDEDVDKLREAIPKCDIQR